MEEVFFVSVLRLAPASVSRWQTSNSTRIVGGYAYNDARICVTQGKRVLERQMFEDSVDGMLSLASETPNELTNMKSIVSITRKHIL